ncbi:MAG: hypothetical protein QOF01_2654, partial [Thermomicrobiales bacterium]|nr:hypothetical protein [Thermomicrobiales bacterium]
LLPGVQCWRSHRISGATHRQLSRDARKGLCKICPRATLPHVTLPASAIRRLTRLPTRQNAPRSGHGDGACGALAARHARSTDRHPACPKTRATERRPIRCQGASLTRYRATAASSARRRPLPSSRPCHHQCARATGSDHRRSEQGKASVVNPAHQYNTIESEPVIRQKQTSATSLPTWRSHIRCLLTVSYV